MRPTVVTLDSPPHLPFLMSEGKSLEHGPGAALEMQRFSYLKGMRLRDVSPVPSKRSRAFSETLYKGGVQKLWSLGPEEASSQAVLCKSGLMEGWTEYFKQRKAEEGE